MAEKVSKAKAQELINEWGRQSRKLTALTAQRDVELQPFTLAYQEQCQPVNDKYNPKIEKLNNSLAEIGKQLTEYLEAGIDRETNEIKLRVLEGEAGKDGLYPCAEVEPRSQRTISARVFFDKIADRTQDFFECLTVGIAKAERWLGSKRVDEIADSKTTFNIKLAMRKVKTADDAKRSPKAKANAAE